MKTLKGYELKYLYGGGPVFSLLRPKPPEPFKHLQVVNGKIKPVDQETIRKAGSRANIVGVALDKLIYRID